MLDCESQLNLKEAQAQVKYKKKALDMCLDPMVGREKQL